MTETLAGRLEVLHGGEPEASLLDVIDRLLNQGVVLKGDLALGVAGVDLIYAQLSLLLGAVDRILRNAPEAQGASPEAQGASPEVQGASPEAQGASPEAQDAWPEAQGARPEAQDAWPEAQGARPEAQDAWPEPQGAPPEAPLRWNADPEDVQRSVLKLVLTLVELLRQVMERQAIRRMEAATLTDGEAEAVGTALMRLEETIYDLARRFDIPPEELNLDLGPLGRLL